MCVLQMYELGAEDNACKLYNSLVTAGTTGQHEIDSWPADLPWLYYTAGEQPQYVLPISFPPHPSSSSSSLSPVTENTTRGRPF